MSAEFVKCFRVVVRSLKVFFSLRFVFEGNSQFSPSLPVVALTVNTFQLRQLEFTFHPSTTKLSFVSSAFRIRIENSCKMIL